MSGREINPSAGNSDSTRFVGSFPVCGRAIYITVPIVLMKAPMQGGRRAAPGKRPHGCGPHQRSLLRFGRGANDCLNGLSGRGRPQKYDMTMIALCCSVQQRVLLSMISIVATVLLAASTAGRRFALLSDVDRIHFVEAEAGAVHFTFLKQLLGTGDAGVWPIPIRTDIPDPILATVAAFINENSAPDVRIEHATAIGC